ncbi:hypothetical protein [Janthinobacterium sp. 17J80-10]|uniref:TlpA family protein disulfide reductase n=1 Tax=Janthinobacterium sp. 17J80-10 TaxID=2497863 RepID=UPI0010059E2C|nr:hypothetical protein [Janthinobacterium sp. 17J80-10]QAU34997.1 hypothetical protein EKL02_12855 [Janthinobacterium sp. 17J80-10]
MKTVSARIVAAIGMAVFLGAGVAAAPAAATGPAAQTLRAFEPDSFERLVAQQQGKPFVLVLWSLDCQYCIASLKTLGQEQRKRKALRVVTLSTDAAADPELGPMMRQRLAAFGLPGNAWAYGEAPAEQLRYMIDPKWHGEKPRSYWFNARGERIAHSGLITPATIDQLTSGW